LAATCLARGHFPVSVRTISPTIVAAYRGYIARWILPNAVVMD
jgi:hypothetical protein